jgi:hypothetical protein
VARQSSGRAFTIAQQMDRQLECDRAGVEVAVRALELEVGRLAAAGVSCSIA